MGTFALPARALLLLAPTLTVACGSRPPEGGGTPVPAAPVAAEVPDSLRGPLILSLRRDSLGLATGAADSVVKRSMDSAVAVLQGVKAFEVLAPMPPILALKIRPAPGITSAELIEALRTHRLVLAVEPDGFVTIQGATGGRP